MNYIKTIAARGLKSGDFKHDLARVNVFTGKSFSGKTARMEAIRLGLIKYLPELGKNGTMALARNGAMTIALTDDSGKKSVNEWNDKCKTGRAVNDEFPPTPAVLMDPSIYFALSDKKKMEYAFSMFKMESGYSYEAVIERVGNELLERLIPAPKEDGPTSGDEIKKLMTDSAFESENILGQSIQEWIEALIVKMKERLSGANAIAKRMTAAVQANVTIASGEKKQYRNPEKELSDARQKLIALEKESQELAGKSKLVQELDGAKKTAEENLAAAKVEPDATLETRIAALKKEIEDLEGKPLAVTDQTELKADLEALNQFLIANHSNTDDLRARKQAVENTIEFVTLQKTNLIREGKKTMAAHDEALEKGCCAHCGALAEHWSEDHSKAKLKKEIAAWTKAYRAKVETFDERLKDERASLEGITKQIDGAKKADEVLVTKKADAQAIQKRLDTIAANNEIVRLARDCELKAMRKELEDLTSAQTKQNRDDDNRKHLEATLASVVEELAKFDRDAIALKKEQLEIEIVALNEAIKILEQVQVAYLAGKQDEKHNAQVLIQQAQANADVEVTKAVISILEAIQAEMVEAAFGKILKTVNLVTSSVMPEPIEYRAGEIGRVSCGTWVTHATFSGTEKALVYCGLSLALAEKAPIRIVMIDELGRLDEDSLNIVLGRMIELTKTGVVDQFVGALSTRRDFVMEGVNVIKL